MRLVLFTRNQLRPLRSSGLLSYRRTPQEPHGRLLATWTVCLAAPRRGMGPQQSTE